MPAWFVELKDGFRNRAKFIRKRRRELRDHLSHRRMVMLAEFNTSPHGERQYLLRGCRRHSRTKVQGIRVMCPHRAASGDAPLKYTYARWFHQIRTAMLKHSEPLCYNGHVCILLKLVSRRKDSLPDAPGKSRTIMSRDAIDKMTIALDRFTAFATARR